MNNIETIIEECEGEVSSLLKISELETVKVKYLGKNGLVNDLMKQLAAMPFEKKKEFGMKVNILKEKISEMIEIKKSNLEDEAIISRINNERIDVSLDKENKYGKIHPTSQMIDELLSVFSKLGFTFVDGPEIEDQKHNFSDLNVPENHPARQMHDTFYLNKRDENNEPMLLRTHTSSVQIRAMKENKPPFRFLSIGRTYRCDSDVTHTPMFHQMEGICLDKNINMGHLKHTIIIALRELFEIDNLPIRFRPSYFPFTEPSVEIDIGCKRSKDQLTIGDGEDWLEIMGAGMIHPNVLKSVNINDQEWQGFAFGMGIERLAMLKYGIPDLRDFFHSDKRWLSNYGFTSFDIPSILTGGLSE